MVFTAVSMNEKKSLSYKHRNRKKHSLLNRLKVLGKHLDDFYELAASFAL